MCGFVSKVSIRNAFEPADVWVLKTATRLLAHRGPDDEAFYFSPQFSVGFRRLKIIDLSDNARQPMADETERYRIVFNGEIYNYRELRTELIRAGVRFRTQSDTEVLLKAFIHWGENCLERLNGMFAFLIWNEKEETLFGARDRFGEKPLYYIDTDNSIYFASEIKALIPLLGKMPEPNRMVIRNYIQSRQADAANETFYEGILSVPAAHKLIVKNGKMTIRRYWQLEAREVECEDPIGQFRQLFLDSVRLRLRADVPVGTCLSGGLDSGAIACSIPQVLKNGDTQTSRKTFTAAYPEFDESKLVAEVNRVSGSRGFSMVPTPASLEDLGELIRFHDEPFHSFMVFASYNVMKLARDNGVKVLLNGQGADELLAGYSKYMSAYLRDLFRRGRIFSALNIAKQSSRLTKRSTFGMLTRMIQDGLLVTARRVGVPNSIKSSRRERFAIENCGLSPAFARETNDLHLTQSNKLNGRSSILKRRLYDSLTLAHLPLYLRVEDRNSMALSLESRLPFLDHRLAEFVFSLPTSLFMERGTNKYVLREAMTGILPDSVRTRKDKFGFPVPEIDWLYGDFRDHISDLLKSTDFRNREIFNAVLLQRKFENELSMWNAGDKKELKQKRGLWFRVISLELWFRNMHETSRDLQKQHLINQ